MSVGTDFITMLSAPQTVIERVKTGEISVSEAIEIVKRLEAQDNRPDGEPKERIKLSDV